MHLTDYIAWAPMIVLIVVLGVYPNLLFQVMDPAVNVALAAFEGSGG
jgi:NADH:ubiquinone oxidoreductase subunit 4 (subunit M)